MKIRPRRLRSRSKIRALVREVSLRPTQLIQPYFVKSGKSVRRPIGSMPGQFQLSVDQLIIEAKKAKSAGVGGVILFGIPDKKDEKASGAYAPDGIVQEALRALRDKVPELVLITDVCLCEYMSHGHCGVVLPTSQKGGRGVFKIDNDASVELIAKTALSHVEAGADIVAPSDMMDGRVKAIRKILDQNAYEETPILSYAVKYASSFYGPFREAAESPPQFGDRRTYQMDPANIREALREAKLDEKEGADILMVKPALPYLDIIKTVREHTHLPVAAYQVSAEYAMIKAAGEKGWIDEPAVVLESLTAIRRAGADLIVTYFATDVAKSL